VLAVVSLVVAQALAAGASAGPPPACADETTHRANAWERAKSPELGRYCDLLASASSKLAGSASMATAALDAAQQADKILPGRGAALALEGRAFAALGRASEAVEAFQLARARDARALDEPQALLAYARTLSATGHISEALVGYRALLPRSSALPPSERAAIAAEAGIVAMQLGPDTIDEAAADLREALRGSHGDAERFVVLALALALDRSARGDEGRTLLSERARGEPRAAVSAWERKSPVPLKASEGAAIAAFGLEGSDVAGARDQWEESLKADPKGLWAMHSRSRLAALGVRAPGAEKAR
jgi:tetratricopeptide (TPR) repeat protein